MSIGQGTYGIDWAKVMNKDQVALVLEKAQGYPKHYRVFMEIARQTGWRLCEIYHLTVDDLLPGGKIRMTKRKKRVLRQEVRDVTPSLYALLTEWCKGRIGWLFPGGCSPCVIKRRPKFEETRCPDCERELLSLRMVRRKGDRISVFANHLSAEHRRTPDEIEEWVRDYASVPVEEKICDGGHLHGRTIQRTWSMILAEAQLRMHGRGIHTLRHYVGLSVYRKTKDLLAVKQMLGHENVQTSTLYAQNVQMEQTVKELDGEL